MAEMMEKKIPLGIGDVKKRFPVNLDNHPKKVPVVMQFDSSDCGVACASSICAYNGKDIGLSRIRELIKAGGLYAEMWKNQVGKE